MAMVFVNKSNYNDFFPGIEENYDVLRYAALTVPVKRPSK